MFISKEKGARADLRSEGSSCFEQFGTSSKVYRAFPPLKIVTVLEMALSLRNGGRNGPLKENF